MQFVDSQEEFNHYNKQLDKYSYFESFSIWHPTRATVFWARFYFYSFFFKFHFKIPTNFGFLKPGLEIKYALEEAQKSGAKTYFLGAELN